MNTPPKKYADEIMDMGRADCGSDEKIVGPLEGKPGCNSLEQKNVSAYIAACLLQMYGAWHILKEEWPVQSI